MWRALALMLVYRVTLLGVLTTSYFLTAGAPMDGLRHPHLVTLALALFGALTILSYALLHWRTPPLQRQIQVTVLSDVLVLCLLMYAGGGASSGFGLLVAVSVTLGSLLSLGSMAFPFAAAASLAVLAQETLLELLEPASATSFTRAGLLGATYFSVALLSHALATRLRQTEQVAVQRGIDLANLARLNEHVIQSMETGVIVVDETGDIRLSNRAASRILGDQVLQPGAALAQSAPALAKSLKDWWSTPLPGPFLIKPLDSGAETRVTPVPLGAKPSAGLLAFVEDNDRLQQRAQEMKLASLGRLSAGIAHEIRNPLGAISHAAQLLDETSTSPKDRHKLVEIIQRNSMRLNEIIESVMQLSRRDPPRTSPVQLASWLADLSAEILQPCQDDGDTIELELPPRIPEVHADPRHLRQILSILVENARKHARVDGKPVRILIRVGKDLRHRTCRVEVVDDGPGIAPDQARFLFEPFFTTSGTGAGLGLYLARELCEANRIVLDHIPTPSGACFRLTLPVEQNAHRGVGS